MPALSDPIAVVKSSEKIQYEIDDEVEVDGCVPVPHAREHLDLDPKARSVRHGVAHEAQEHDLQQVPR